MTGRKSSPNFGFFTTVKIRAKYLKSWFQVVVGPTFWYNFGELLLCGLGDFPTRFHRGNILVPKSQSWRSELCQTWALGWDGPIIVALVWVSDFRYTCPLRYKTAGAPQRPKISHLLHFLITEEGWWTGAWNVWVKTKFKDRRFTCINFLYDVLLMRRLPVVW